MTDEKMSDVLKQKIKDHYMDLFRESIKIGKTTICSGVVITQDPKVINVFEHMRMERVDLTTLFKGFKIL